jgi:uncharacterized membrane protein YidH (DUF202 family)
MNRSTPGLVVLGIVFVVLGAIFAFAINVDSSGFNINTVGVILLLVGIGSFATGLWMYFAASKRSVTEEVHETPAGHERAYEERGDLTP